MTAQCTVPALLAAGAVAAVLAGCDGKAPGPIANGAFAGGGTSIVMIFSTLPDVSVTWMRRLLRSAM